MVTTTAGFRAIFVVLASLSLGYPGEADGPSPLSDRYYFSNLENGQMFDIALNKTAAIHRVVGDL